MAVFFLAVLVFIFADVVIRFISKEIHAKKIKKERAVALEANLKVDFSREAKSLKRIEVESPKARILCVDDEEVILDSFRKILVLDGYCVDTVSSGREALGLIQVRQYDFVFTDLKMPEMDGVEVTKAVKSLRPDIDVIIITGFASVETAVETMKSGAMNYVQKPFTEDELLEFLRIALIKRQDNMQRQLKPTVRICQYPDAIKNRPNEFVIPGGVFIAEGHCWAAVTQGGGVEVGIDDFARKLIGKIDGVDYPKPGMVVTQGQPLFSVRQKNRSVPFVSPVTGKVAKLNTALNKNPELFEISPYGGNWVCTIESENFDADLRSLKIGNSAVVLIQDDVERFLLRAGTQDAAGANELRVGVMEQYGDSDWNDIAKKFFRKPS
ncbi:MAG: response regulator [bacterium]